MDCFKCKREMVTMIDTSWNKHNDKSKLRITEFMCPECRIYVCLDVTDYSECDLEDE